MGIGTGTNLITLCPTHEWLMMLRRANVDLLAYDGAPCSEAAGSLTEAIQRIEADPDACRRLGPPGCEHDTGSGGVVELLRWAAEKCARRPEAIVRIRIREARGPR